MYYTRIHQRRFNFDAFFSGVVFIISLTIFLALFITRSEFFRVQKIIVHGEDSSLKERITTSLASQARYLFSSPAHIAYSLKGRYLPLKEVEVDIDFFSRSFIISYTLRDASFLWCKPTTCYLVDREGVIFEDTPLAHTPFLIKVEDRYFHEVMTGRKIPSSAISSLLATHQFIQDKNLPFLRSIIESPFSLKVVLDTYPELLFTTHREIKTQLDTLEQFFHSLPQEEFSKLQYVDLRVKNRIYYK